MELYHYYSGIKLHYAAANCVTYTQRDLQISQSFDQLTCYANSIEFANVARIKCSRTVAEMLLSDCFIECKYASSK